MMEPLMKKMTSTKKVTSTISNRRRILSNKSGLWFARKPEEATRNTITSRSEYSYQPQKRHQSDNLKQQAT